MLAQLLKPGGGSLCIVAYASRSLARDESPEKDRWRQGPQRTKPRESSSAWWLPGCKSNCANVLKCTGNIKHSSIQMKGEMAPNEVHSPTHTCSRQISCLDESPTSVEQEILRPTDFRRCLQSANVFFGTSFVGYVGNVKMSFEYVQPMFHGTTDGIAMKLK